jgi:hypothetical protein
MVPVSVGSEMNSKRFRTDCIFLLCKHLHLHFVPADYTEYYSQATDDISGRSSYDLQ